MILDLILFRPEFFLLFSFFVLLWYGTGNLVRPVAEVLIVQRGRLQKKNIPHFQRRRGFQKNPTRGPNHAVSAQTLWRIVWCFLAAFLQYYSPQYSVLMGGTFNKNSYSSSLSVLLFRTRGFVLSLSLGWQKQASIWRTEYIYLAMLALIGQYQMISARDQMSLYICMELQSFSLVVLCGLNSKSAYSLERAMKYFLQSAFRSCLLLLGIGFLYVQTGETNIFSLQRIVQRTRMSPSLMMALGIWQVTVGLLWKQAAAPLHFWVPDVYMGAWSSVSLWITVQPKISVLGFWTAHWQSLWSFHFGKPLVFFRRLSMIVGRIRPQAQTNLKRLLAYSSIGHMGLLLMPLCTDFSSIEAFLSLSSENVNSSIFTQRYNGNRRIRVLWAYMILYIRINLGVWGLLIRETVRPSYKKYSGPQYLWDLKGLKSSSGRIRFRWRVLMRSLAGIPPVYAFLGKRALLWTSVNNGLYGLVIVALRYSLIGRVYYLKIIKICYVDTPTSQTTYGRFSSMSRYIIRRSVFFMILGMWHSNTLFQWTHVLALQI